MKSLLASMSTLLLLLAPSMQTATEQIDVERDGIRWHTDLAAAKELAAEKRAPLFVVFRCEA